MTKYTIADYQVIHKGSFKLSASNPTESVRSYREFSVNLPTNLVFGELRAMLILQYEIQPDERSQLRFYMNNRMVSDPTYSQSNTRMGQIVFPYSAAVPERCHKPTYPLKFELNGGQLTLQDVVLWYQVHIEI